MKSLVVLTIALTQCCGSLGAAASSYPLTEDSLHARVAVLASDSLEGREVGEPGELKAARYIEGVMRSFGLEPRGDDGTYLQAFEFTKRIEHGEKNRLAINGEDLQIGTEFVPLHHTANTAFEFSEIVDIGYGIINEDSSYNDYEDKDVAGKAVLIRRYAPEVEADSADTTGTDTNPYDRYSGLTSKIITALDHDAAGVFFYTPASHDDTLLASGVTRVTPKDIPIVFLRRAGLERLGLDLERPDIRDLVGETDLVRVRDTGYNVIGLLPGATDSAIVAGAHYDHLGWGGPASRYLEKEPKIHYGADDNGSGSAALMELAGYFAGRDSQLRHSLLFIAFSGEEAGLLGSSYFVRNWTVDRTKCQMMVNMDMIGRLKEQEKGLIVMGTGTCEQFKDYFDSLDTSELRMTFSESGSGPSDHAAFYNDSIPTLHFFTGAHEDYHTPSDVIEKIDFGGLVRVTQMVGDIVEHFDSYSGPLVFQRTKDSGEGRHRSSFSVTLGVMPDFISEVRGLRIDGVSPERPADRAGLLKGDIIIRLGEYNIGDIYDYMNALGKFRKDDTVETLIVREADTLTVTVEFK